MNLAHLVSQRRRSLLTLLSMLVAGGRAAAFLLPVSLFPTVVFPRIAIAIEAGERPPGQMEATVTRPVEQAGAADPGGQNPRSTPRPGSAGECSHSRRGRGQG